MRRRLLLFGLAVAWLTVGFLNVARGAAHAGPRYRFWAFQHHCYSDVIALHGDRYLGGAHPLPYLEDRIEYPVLLGLALYLPSFAPGGALGHFTATYLALAACLLLALLGAGALALMLIASGAFSTICSRYAFRTSRPGSLGSKRVGVRPSISEGRVRTGGVPRSKASFKALARSSSFPAAGAAFSPIKRSFPTVHQSTAELLQMVSTLLSARKLRQ